MDKRYMDIYHYNDKWAPDSVVHKMRSPVVVAAGV